MSLKNLLVFPLRNYLATVLTFLPAVLPAQEISDTVHLHEVHIKEKQRAASSTQVGDMVSGGSLQERKGKALADVLKEVAGVNILGSGATITKPVIHGLHSNRVLLFNNSVRLEGQQWGAEHAPELDPLLAERIEVIKGAASVRYGAEAMGGAILVQPPTLPVKAGLHGETSLTGMSNGKGGVVSAMLTGGIVRLPGFGWRLQGTLKQSGNIHTADYVIGNTGLKEQNYSAAIGFTGKNEKYELYYSHFGATPGIMYAAHIASREDIEARISAGRPLEEYDFTYLIAAPRQHTEHDLIKAGVHYDLAPSKTFDLIYAYQRNHRKEYDLRRGDRAALPINDLLLTTHTLDIMMNDRDTVGKKISVGINGIFQVNNNVPGTLANTFIPNYDSFSAGAFLIRNWIARRAEYEFGLRYDFKQFDAAGFRYAYSDDHAGGITEQYYGGKSRFHNLTGTFGSTLRLGEQMRLVSNLGVAWRAPTANELFSNGLHHGAGLFEVGGPELKAERGYKWISGLKYFTSHFDLALDLYVQYIHNYIYSTPDGSFRQTVSGTFPVFRYGQTRAFLKGADFSASFRFGNYLSYSFSASLVEGNDLQNNRYLPFIPAGRLRNRLRFEYEPSKGALPGFYAQLAHDYTGRQNRYTEGSDFIPPPPAYSLFSIAAGVNIKTGRQQFGIGFTAENLFNRLYKDYMDRYRYFVHAQGRNMVLRLNYRF